MKNLHIAITFIIFVVCVGLSFIVAYNISYDSAYDSILSKYQSMDTNKMLDSFEYPNGVCYFDFLDTSTGSGVKIPQYNITNPEISIFRNQCDVVEEWCKRGYYGEGLGSNTKIPCIWREEESACECSVVGDPEILSKLFNLSNQ